MIDPVAFEIGQITVRWYGIIIALAFLLSMFLIIREADKQGIKEDFILDLFIIMIPLAVVGTRLYYIIFNNLSYYIENPAMILNIRSGGLAIHGGIITGILVIYFFCKKHQTSFLKIVDLIAPYLALAQSIGRWGNFFNREAFGGAVSEEFISFFPEFIQRQMYIAGNYYHPAFLYESIWNLTIFIALISIRKKEFIKKGDIFLLYLVGYSIGRFFIEGIRLDSLMFGPFRVAQLISLLAVVIGLFILYKNHRKKRN